MGFWEDLGNNFNNGVKNVLGAVGFDFSPPPANTNSGPQQDPLTYGQADISTGSPSMLPSVSQSAPTPSSFSFSSPNGGGSDFQGVGGDFNPGPSAPTGIAGAGSKPSQTDALNNAFLNMLAQPAMDTRALNAQLSDEFNQIPQINYLDMAKNAYNNTVNQIQGIENGVNQRYGQVNDFLGDLYNINQNAATLGNNNVLQSIAQNEGNAIQGNAKTAADTLAQMKNSQLSTLANAIAAHGGNPADAAKMGDFQKIDPLQAQVAGMTANAMQQANNAQGAAADRTANNNNMAMAIGNQGNIMRQQLANQQLNYQSSMGKYLADLANQEASREMEAVKQQRADQLGILSAQIGLQKNAADAENARIAAIAGGRGIPYAIEANAMNGLDQAKAMQAIAQAQGGSPFQSAMNAEGPYGPQLGNAYTNAINTMQVVPGTKPTSADFYRAMSADPSLQGIPSGAVMDFINRADASKVYGGGTGLPDIETMLASMG